MEDFNVAEILKNCRKGTTLYSPLCGECIFDAIFESIIHVKSKEGDQSYAFYSDGRFTPKGEIMLFPSSDQRDWSKFKLDPEFKPGDLVENDLYYTILCGSNDRESYSDFYITRSNLSIVESSLTFNNSYLKLVDDGYVKSCIIKKLKESGYKLDENYRLKKIQKPKRAVGDHYTIDGVEYIIIDIKDDVYVVKTLNTIYSQYYTPQYHSISVVDSSLPYPSHSKKRGNFKVCDIIVSKMTGKNHIIENFDGTTYITNHGLRFTVDQEDLFDILPEKFDVTTLKRFDRVLVRADNSNVWECDFFSSYNPGCTNPFHCVGLWTEQCIPFNEDTKHLVSKTDEPDKFYVVWENK